MTTTEHTMLAAALTLARCGLASFPADLRNGGKKSYASAQYSNGAAWGKTRDPAQIRYYFRKWPDANLGLPTGADNGFWVLEPDTLKGHGVDGIASLRALEAKHGKLPDTLMAESPSGSPHYYFNWPKGLPEGVEIRNSASVIAPGIDVRGEGGMVIAPPSVRSDGQYRWLNFNPIADAPQWLVELAIAASKSKGKKDSASSEGDPAEAPQASSNGAPRTDEELHQLLEATRPEGEWHENMLRVIATLIGRGRSNSEIKLICASYFIDGFTDDDFADLIDGARKKWNKPNDEAEALTGIDAELARLAQ